jgi:hypothetical protein
LRIFEAGANVLAKKKKRYVLYKTDEWNHPILWQWFRVSLDYKIDWTKQTFFCELFSDFRKWEAIYDPDAVETKLDNLNFVAGFESEELAINHGIEKGWLNEVKAHMAKKIVVR